MLIVVGFFAITLIVVWFFATQTPILSFMPPDGVHSLGLKNKHYNFLKKLKLFAKTGVDLFSASTLG